MAKKKTSVVPKPKCDWNGCSKDAIGGFHETENVGSFTTASSLAISETHWCAEHDTSEHFYGKTGDFVVFP
jgi:hypothetical protein